MGVAELVAISGPTGGSMCASGNAIGRESRRRERIERGRSVSQPFSSNDDRRIVVAAHRGAREEVVVAGTLAESVEVNLSTAIAREGERAVWVNPRREVELV
jgi:hypothetical protein